MGILYGNTFWEYFLSVGYGFSDGYYVGSQRVTKQLTGGFYDHKDT